MALITILDLALQMREDRPLCFTSRAWAADPAASDEKQWRVDDQGRKYTLEKYPKSRPHLRLEGNRLRTVWGITVDLDSEDEANFYYRAYRTEPSVQKPVEKGPSESEKAAVAETYRFELKTRRQLRFEPFDEGLPKSGQWRNGFVLADMNEDGKLDIVHGPQRKRHGTPVIFLNDGKGKWRRWTEATFSGGPFDYGDVAVADFNGDGHQDMALGMHLLGVTALLGDGRGNFKTAAQGMDPLQPGKGFSSRALAVVDWNRDGRIDFLALGEGPRMETGRVATKEPSKPSMSVRLYLNKGNGTWEKQDSVPGDRSFGESIAVIRLGEGTLGFVIGSRVMGDRDILYVSTKDGPWVKKTLECVRPHALTGGVAIADFDGDGREDIALGYQSYEAGEWRSGIDLLFQRPEGRWERRTLYVEGGPRGFPALAAGDFDRNGAIDLAAASEDGRIIIILNDGKGNYTREEVELTEAAGSCRGYGLAIADLDGDGFGDLVASFAGEPEGVMTLRTPGCPGEGSLRAWRSMPARAPAEPAGDKPAVRSDDSKKSETR
jgi:hypothetical protein